MSTGERLNVVNAARLIAIDRGNDKIRPIAIGEVMRRLAASCVTRSHDRAIEARVLKAKNLAFSKDGSATVFKTVQVLLEANTDFLLVETDLAAAFHAPLDRHQS